MNLFNNREIAIAVWILVIFIILLFIRGIRESLKDLVKVLFHRKILILVLSIIVYTVGITFVLYLLNFWNISLLKDTILWLCFSGIVICFRYVSSKEDENLLRNIIIDNIKIVIIIEFIANFFTFSLAAELVLIPFMAFIAGLDVIAKTDKKNISVVRLLNGLQIIIGLFIFIYAFSQAIADYKNIVNLDTLKSFLLAPLLAVLFSPFVYFMALLVKYELLFLRLEMGCEKSKKLKNYAKKKIILYCLLSLKKTKKALNMKTYNLMLIRNKDDVDEMVKAYRS
jgi:hypothetical protein